MEPTVDRPPHRFGSSRLWRRVAIAAVLLGLLWSAAWFYVPPIVAAQAAHAAERELGRRLAIGHVVFNPWTLELTLSDVSLAAGTAGGPPTFEARRVYADLAAVSLLHLAPVIDALEVDAPMLRASRVDEGRYDIDDILQRLAAAPPSPTPARFAVHNIVVRDGAADVVDRPLAETHRLRGLELAVPFVSSLPSERQVKVEPHLAFLLDGSRFDTAGAATPFAERGNGELHLKLEGFAVEPYLGYLPRGLPAQLRKAIVDADVVVAFEQRPKLSLNVAGRVAASGIEVVDGAAGELLQVGRIALDIEALRPLERVVRLKRLEVDSPHLVAARNAAGRVNLLLVADASSGADAASGPHLPLPSSAGATSAPAASGPAAHRPAGAASASLRSAGAASGAASAAGGTSGSAPWQVSLAALSLRAGRLDWRDATTSPAAALAVSDVTLEAQSIAWPMASPVAFRGEARLGNAAATGHVVFSGAGDGTGAALKLALDALPLASLRPYLREFVAPRVGGDLSAEVAVDWRAGSGSPRLKVDATRLALAGLVLGEPAAPELVAERIEASGVHVDAVARSVAIDRFALGAPRLRVERDGQGHWAFERWAAASPSAAAARSLPLAAASSPAAAAASAPDAAASTAVAMAPWRLTLGELALERGRVGVVDRAAAPPVSFDVVDLALQLRDYALDRRGASPFHLAARVSVPSGPSGKAAGSGVVGSVDVRGELADVGAGVPARAQAAILVKDLPLHLLDPYLHPILDVEVQKAQASFKGDIRWASAAPGATLALRGDAAVDDFRASSAATDRAAGLRPLAMVRESGGGRQLLNWKSLSLRGIELAIAPGAATRLSVAETALSDFFARIVLDEQGRLNLQDVTRPTAPAAAATPASGSAAVAGTAAAPAPSAAAAPILSFGPIAVVGGRINYDDRFVKPNYTANISELSGRLAAFSSATPASGPPPLAELALRGRVEGTATLEIAGKVNPLARPLALDLTAKVRDLELPPLSPYAIKYAGYGIERGKMSVDLAYVVQPDGQLTASNKIVLNQLAFGDKVEGAPASLPVKLAVALLADRHGVIDLDLPVSGSINDPQFSLGGVIWKVITNLVAKAVTAPFSLLASALGGGEGELARVEFAAGTATLDERARGSLDKVAKALADRPALTLTVTGESRMDRERDAWKKDRLAQIVRSEKRRQAIAGGAGAAAAVTVSEAEYPALLKEVYRRADIVKPKNVLGLAKDLPPAEMEALLLAAMSVGDDAMQQLAVRRGVVVRDYLAARDIAAERLFLGAPKTASDDAAWTPRADLRLAAS